MKTQPSDARRMDTDAEEAKVVAFLKAHGIRFWRPSPHQIKVGQWSFYPSTGSILCDGKKKEAKTGAGTFIEIIRRIYPDHRDSLPLDCLV